MKILGIRASGRTNGNSSIILNELLRPAKELGFEIIELNLASLHLKHCAGCFGCNNSELKCVIKDDLEQLKEQIAAADGIALVSPCYALGAASTLKTVMDRLAAWALNTIRDENKKFGVAVSVGGGTEGWYTLQRIFMSEFLGIFNCHVIGQYTIHDLGLKGEILLQPSILNLVRDFGTKLAVSIESGKVVKSAVSETEDCFICPNCFNDTFQIRRRGIFRKPSYNCPVCNWTSLKVQPLAQLLKQPINFSNTRFTKKEAGVHFQHIGAKITHGMDSSAEVQRRAAAYFERGLLPENDYTPSEAPLLDIEGKVTWEPDAEATFQQMCPKPFQSFVKKAVEKKAFSKGFTVISKELFLTIKKESGN